MHPRSGVEGKTHYSPPRLGGYAKETDIVMNANGVVMFSARHQFTNDVHLRPP